MNQEFKLSREQLEQFDRDGVIGPLPQFLPDHSLDALRDYFEDVELNKREQPLYGRFSCRDWHLISPETFDLFTHPALVAPLRQLAGNDLVLWRSKLFYKRPGEGELGWHQEWGYFNGEEIGNDKPSLIASRDDGRWWNLTVWVALNDVTPENGAVQFVRGSHRTRYPIEMVPMTDSAFYHDPFIGVDDPKVIIERALTNKLILDIDTRHIFKGMDPFSLSMEALRTHVHQAISQMKAAITLPFEVPPENLVTMSMRKGQFVIFTERTMHGSLPNKTNRGRVGINCRVTTTDTLIYPQRLKNDFIDGSNLDISRHHCILLSGEDRSGKNVYGPGPRTLAA